MYSERGVGSLVTSPCLGLVCSQNFTLNHQASAFNHQPHLNSTIPIPNSREFATLVFLWDAVFSGLRFEGLPADPGNRRVRGALLLWVSLICHSRVTLYMFIGT